jgi:hypothetical protein
MGGVPLTRKIHVINGCIGQISAATFFVLQKNGSLSCVPCGKLQHRPVL